MKEVAKIISVFGSSAPQPGSAAFDVALTVGRLLAEASFTVATGGYGGTMLAVSQGAAQAGGHVIGVGSARIELFRGAKLNPWVKEAHNYNSLADRLLHLVTENAGIIVLPGGIGTLSEMALAWSLLQVGEIGRRPMALLGEMWRETIASFARSDYVSERYLDLLYFTNSPEAAVAHVTGAMG